MPIRKRIPVAEPILGGNEQRYVIDCLETGWISGSGKYVQAFEEHFAAYCGAKYAVAVFNGTVALHVALVAAGIGSGDEVIVPDQAGGCYRQRRHFQLLRQQNHNDGRRWCNNHQWDRSFVCRVEIRRTIDA